MTISGSGRMNDWSSNVAWGEVVPYANYRQSVKSVVISEGITYIGSNAFYDFENITYIQLPSSLTEIGEEAFSSCSSLENIQFPANLKTINEGAFKGCYKLTNIVLPNSLTKLGDLAFNACSLTEITIPSGVAVISEGAFCNNGRLTSITIPEGVKEIQKDAFKGCYLQENDAVSIPKSVTMIGESAFGDANSRARITILNSETVIYDEARLFGNATVIGYQNSTAEQYAHKNQQIFLCMERDGKIKSQNNIVTGKCGKNVTYTLDKVTGVITISGSGDMDDCTYDTGCNFTMYKQIIDKVVIEAGVTRIGAYAFWNCFYLKSIELSEGLIGINEGGLSLCYNLESVDFPASVQYVSKNTFYKDKIKSLIFRNSQTQIDDSIVGSVSLLNSDLTIYGYDNSTAKSYYNKLIELKKQSNTKYNIFFNSLNSLKNGLFLSADGTWNYYSNGAIDYNYTGLGSNEYGWWYIKNGAVDFSYTGLASNEYGWWYIKNGAVDFGYTGLASNEYGWWYIENGAVNFNYTGTASNEYGTWNVVNGAVVF